MRMNLPVTQREHAFPDDAVILSHTDAGAIITGVNRAFPDASGYGREKLMGQPHNLPRHPDMHAGSIRDLWAAPASRKVIVGCVTQGRGALKDCQGPAGPVQNVSHA